MSLIEILGRSQRSALEYASASGQAWLRLLQEGPRDRGHRLGLRDADFTLQNQSRLNLSDFASIDGVPKASKGRRGASLLVLGFYEEPSSAFESPPVREFPMRSVLAPDALGSRKRDDVLQHAIRVRVSKSVCGILVD